MRWCGSRPMWRAHFSSPSSRHFCPLRETSGHPGMRPRPPSRCSAMTRFDDEVGDVLRPRCLYSRQLFNCGAGFFELAAGRAPARAVASDPYDLGSAARGPRTLGEKFDVVICFSRLPPHHHPQPKGGALARRRGQTTQFRGRDEARLHPGNKNFLQRLVRDLFEPGRSNKHPLAPNGARSAAFSASRRRAILRAKRGAHSPEGPRSGK